MQGNTFIDKRRDGDGVYAQADFQRWQRTCPPNLPYCYWTWLGIVENKRIVCVDQSWEPDACDDSRWLYP